MKTQSEEADEHQATDGETRQLLAAPSSWCLASSQLTHWTQAFVDGEQEQHESEIQLHRHLHVAAAPRRDHDLGCLIRTAF
jgi:hypothetical protein